ncbi:MAG: hypothetical protein JST65_06995 [Acidobacteria bacterium]|nr:hypothetical protein [Acidobacteriota bacterium]
MRSACEASVNELKTYFAGNPPTSREQAIAIHLHVVADTFVQIQHQRNEADYNVSKDWKPTEVVSLVSSVAVAFRSWKIVRGEPAAQALLVAMLGGRDRREGPRTGTRTKPIPPIPSEDSLPVE